MVLTPVILRDYQRDAVNAAYDSWNNGNKNVCLVLPTGAGKSVCISEIVFNSYRTGQKVAVIAHRNELVSQMACHLTRRNIPHKIIAPSSTVSQIIKKERSLFGKSFVNPSSDIAVVGVDTLMSRSDDMKSWAEQIDLWVIDETHHLIRSNKWGKAVNLFSHAYGLGVTATPARADGQGLGRKYDGVMDSLIVGPVIRQLIDLHHLSDYEIVCPKSDINVDNIKLSSDGDWCSKNLKKAAKESKIIGDVVENYKKYATGRQAIIFATDIETANDISLSFNEAGIKAACVNGMSKASFREQSLNLFANKQVKILVNVDLFDEGFDCPECEVCIMARPTASLGKYLQMIGRVLRPSENKTALIIDHVSNVLRHGLPDRQRTWSLNRREKKAKMIKDPDELELTICPNCLKPYEKFRTCCPYCGTSKSLPQPKSRSVEMVDGDLILLDTETLAKMRSNTVLENPADIQKRVAAVAGPIAGKGVANRQIEKINAQKELIDSIAQWAAIERLKGFSDSEIYRKFYLTTGVDVLSSLSIDRSKQDYLTLAETIKEWYNRGCDA